MVAGNENLVRVPLRLEPLDKLLDFRHRAGKGEISSVNEKVALAQVLHLICETVRVRHATDFEHLFRSGRVLVLV